MRMRALAVLAAAGALVAGCGGSSSNGIAAKSPSAIIAAARSAVASATAVHVAGSIASAGGPMTLDMHLVGDDHASGEVTTGGLRLDVIRIGDTVYFRGSQAFYEKFAGSAAAALFKGKWLYASATKGPLASFAPLTDMQTFFHTLLTSHGTLAKGAEATVAGQKAIAIEDSSKGGTLYVATTGKPLPVEIQSPKPKGGTVTFTDWNKSVKIAAPAGAINLSKLESG